MSSHSQDKWTLFEATLTEGERQVIQQIIQDLQSGVVDQTQLQADFFSMATPILERVQAGHPGPLWGYLKKQYTPIQRDAELIPLTDLAREFPYPLGYKVRQLLQADLNRKAGQPEPMFAFEICSIMGLSLIHI